ncbi:MAG: hypothetical protein DRH24_11025 [Deltaproteobacteria bacterium]|nr:MAG: hypothetical protein DRH24_11025 [Deltaproteobacteria bacterium]
MVAGTGTLRWPSWTGVFCRCAAIEYCVTVNEDGDPDDIPVFTGCDDEIFTSGTLINLNDYSIQLEPDKTYSQRYRSK